MRGEPGLVQLHVFFKVYYYIALSLRTASKLHNIYVFSPY
jgi:hypothetical protein